MSRRYLINRGVLDQLICMPAKASAFAAGHHAALRQVAAECQYESHTEMEFAGVAVTFVRDNR